MNKKVFYKIIFRDLIKGKISSILDFKYYKRWKHYLQPNRNSVTDRLPWITFPAIDLLKKKLKPGDIVFEYGGGGSTLFFLDRVNKVITVEHDKEWFAILKTNLSGSDQLKWQGNLIQAEENKSDKVLDSAKPDDYFSADNNFQQMTFRSYASYIDRFPDEYFDAILIDGRARPSCLKHAVNKVKKGGILILDNTERLYYLIHSHTYLNNFELILNKFAPVPYIQHFVQTSIYKRIK